MEAITRPILVADDEPDVRQLLEEYLTGIGHDVITAANGLEALWAVKHHAPRVVLLDLAMPRLGGLDAIKHIQRFDRTIRIIVVTGNPTREAALALRDLGIPIVAKPLDLDLLSNLVA